MIVKLTKSRNKNDFIDITSSSDDSFENLRNFKVPYDLSISGDENNYVFLPVSQKEVEILNIINNFDNTLVDLGLKLKTGLTVAFRNKELLSDTEDFDNVPLFLPCHFNNGYIKFPLKNYKNQYISTDKDSLLHSNQDFLFLKRFTSKEENRRLQPAIYLHDDYSKFDKISTDNKVNFIATVRKDDDLSINEIYGLFALFNSTLYDKYYRILNGSTQVNASEINSMHVPNRDDLEKIGYKLINCNNMSTKICDELLGDLIA